MLFRLIAILWTVALLAVCVTTFGPEGALAAVIVVLFWRTAFGLTRHPFLEWIGCAFGGCAYLMVLIIALHPGEIHGVERLWRDECGRNLKYQALAMLWGEILPLATSPGLDGAGPRSWRVDLLPMLEQQTLYDEYRQDKSWDGPFNRFLSRKAPDIYRCPSAYTRDGEAFTNYFAIVGGHTSWPPDRGRPLSEITDDPANTILLIECVGRDTPWSKPEDLTFDEAIELLTNPPDGAVPHEHRRTTGFFYKSDAGPSLNVVFVNGRYRLLDLPISKELATALLTVDGGELVDERDFEPPPAELELVYVACYGCAAFMLLALLPFARFFTRKAAIPVQPAA